MDQVIFEDSIRYDPWIKVILAISLMSLVVLGALFYIDAHNIDIFPKEPAAESRVGSLVLFASAVFVLAVYWLVLPRTIAVSQEGIIIRFNPLRWKIPFRTIESIKPAQGIIVFWAHSWITAYATQIEIRRRYRLKIRISPAHRDEFLEYANRALADWRSAHLAREKSRNG